jgi:hypothetical protein
MTLIPLNTVYITYKPTTAATVTRVYYGVIMGVCRDLHDLVTADNGGHYEAVEADTMVVDPADPETGFLLRGDALLDASALDNSAVKGAESGDITNISIDGLTYANSDGGKLYYAIVDNTTTYTLNLYRTQRVVI